MRRLMLAAGLAAGFAAFTATGAQACGWSTKTVSTPEPTKTVMAPATPAPKPSSGG